MYPACTFRVSCLVHVPSVAIDQHVMEVSRAATSIILQLQTHCFAAADVMFGGAFTLYVFCQVSAQH